MKLTIENEKTGSKLEMDISKNFNPQTVLSAYELMMGDEEDQIPLEEMVERFENEDIVKRAFEETHELTKDEMDLFEGGWRTRNIPEKKYVESFPDYKIKIDCPSCLKKCTVHEKELNNSIECPTCSEKLFLQYASRIVGTPDRNGFHAKANKKFNRQ